MEIVSRMLFQFTQLSEKQFIKFVDLGPLLPFGPKLVFAEAFLKSCNSFS